MYMAHMVVYHQNVNEEGTMTVSRETAREVAQKIYDRLETAGVKDPLVTGLEIVEAMQSVPGNKSFRESLDLIHKMVKAYHMYKKKNPG